MHLVTPFNLASFPLNLCQPTTSTASYAGSFKAYKTVHTSSALSLNRQEEGKNIKGKMLGKEQLKTQRNQFNVVSLGVCNWERQK